MDSRTLLETLGEEEMEFIFKNSEQREEMIAPLFIYLQKIRSTFTDLDAYKRHILSISLNSNQKRAVFNIYKNAIPAAETPIGIILAQNFISPRQQYRLNIKNATVDNVAADSTQYSIYSSEECRANIEHFLKTTEEFGILGTPGREDTMCTSFILDIDHPDGLEVKTFTSNVLYPLIADHIIGITQNEISASADGKRMLLFFSIYTSSADSMIQSYSALSKCATQNWNGSLDYIFTTAKKMLNKDNPQAYIHNNVLAIYCILTGRYKPDVDSFTDALYLAIITCSVTMQYCGNMNNLKRPGLLKAGYCPLTFIITESGYYETNKFILGNKKQDFKSVFPVSSIIQNIFMNTPVNSGVTSENIRVERMDPF